MSSLPLPATLLSVEDYLKGEERSDLRHEYLAGQLQAMTGTTRAHNLLAGALHALLLPHARQQGCQLFASDMKVRIDQGRDSWFYYPDLLLACQPDDREPLFVRAPCLIVEILSPSTERTDTREKLLAYRLLPSLRGYLLLWQDQMQADLYTRSEDGVWQYARATSGNLHLPCLNVAVPLAEVYQDLSTLGLGAA